MRLRRTWAFRILIAILLVGSWSIRDTALGEEQRVKDFDAPCFDGEKALVLDAGQPPDRRSSRIPRLVECGPRKAIPVLASVLDDPEEQVRRTAGQYLATLGDARGLRAQQLCLADPGCLRDRTLALRLLGASGKQEFAPSVAHEIDRVLNKPASHVGESLRDPSPSDRSLLRAGVVALARLGRPDDEALVLRVVATASEGRLDPDFLEALGYVTDPAARRLLWDAYRRLLREPGCFEPGLGVTALLPLSRLGEETATEALRKVIRGIGTPTNCSMRHVEGVLLASDRVQVFENLKPRDAARFADVVFEVAAQEPEAPGTREAWIALGIMHPQGFGERLFKLAMTKKPHWKRVERGTLHSVIMANAPGLNEAFWREFAAEPIPAYIAHGELAEMRLGRLMFSGARYWMEWTGD